MVNSFISFFKSRIGQDLEHCTLEEFVSQNFMSSRQNLTMRSRCFSIERTLSSTGGFKPLVVAYHRSSTSDWLSPKSLFFSNIPPKSASSLQLVSCASFGALVEIGSIGTTVFFTGKSRGSLTVRDNIARQEKCSSFFSMEDSVF